MPARKPVKRTSVKPKKRVPRRRGESLSPQEARKLKYEPFKPGRFAQYYHHEKGTIPTIYFMTINQERAMGGTPSKLDELAKLGKLDPKKIRRDIPQIRLIPKESIKKYLERQLVDGIKTPIERAEMEKLFANTAHGVETIKRTARFELAAMDWAEHHYGIKFNVDPKILKWLGKLEKKK